MNKKIISVFCASSIALSLGLSACGKSDTSAISYKITESEETMRLGAFDTPHNGFENERGTPWGLEKDCNTEENWRVMADCGYNVALPIYDTTHEHVLKSLANAEKSGVKVLIMDYENPSLHNICQNGKGLTYEEAYSQILAQESKIKARIDEFAAYKSFGGLHVMDEPSMDYYNTIAAAQDWWYKNYPEYEFYVNLYPSYASDTQLYGKYAGEYTFRDYVFNFVETVNPTCISYDHYPLQKAGLRGTVRPQWLSDLETFADASKKYDIPFYIYILTTRHWSYISPELYSEVAWQAYSAMCYGAKGLQTFLYWSYLAPDSDTNNLGTGLVDPQGNKLACYYAVKEVFDEIKSFEGLYMNFDWVGMMPLGMSGSGTYSQLRSPLEKVKGIAAVDATADALVSEFKDKKGNVAYMVMNYSSPFEHADNKVTLKFENADKVLVCKKGKRVVENLKNNTLELDIGCGEGYFVIPVK